MSGKPFFDTNLLIYAISRTDGCADIAISLLAEGGITSVHVLNEFVAVARRKLKMPWQEVLAALLNFRTLCPKPVPITIRTQDSALKIAQRYGYGIYDSLVIAAAIEASCDTLYSEDMQNGQKIQGLTIRNPF